MIKKIYPLGLIAAMITLLGAGCFNNGDNGYIPTTTPPTTTVPTTTVPTSTIDYPTSTPTTATTTVTDES